MTSMNTNNTRIIAIILLFLSGNGVLCAEDGSGKSRWMGLLVPISTALMVVESIFYRPIRASIREREREKVRKNEVKMFRVQLAEKLKQKLANQLEMEKRSSFWDFVLDNDKKRDVKIEDMLFMSSLSPKRMKEYKSALAVLKDQKIAFEEEVRLSEESCGQEDVDNQEKQYIEEHIKCMKKEIAQNQKLTNELDEKLAREHRLMVDLDNEYRRIGDLDEEYRRTTHALDEKPFMRVALDDDQRVSAQALYDDMERLRRQGGLIGAPSVCKEYKKLATKLESIHWDAHRVVYQEILSAQCREANRKYREELSRSPLNKHEQDAAYAKTRQTVGVQGILKAREESTEMLGCTPLYDSGFTDGYSLKPTDYISGFKNEDIQVFSKKVVENEDSKRIAEHIAIIGNLDDGFSADDKKALLASPKHFAIDPSMLLAAKKEAWDMLKDEFGDQASAKFDPRQPLGFSSNIKDYLHPI